MPAGQASSSATFGPTSAEGWPISATRGRARDYATDAARARAQRGAASNARLFKPARTQGWRSSAHATGAETPRRLHGARPSPSGRSTQCPRHTRNPSPGPGGSVVGYVAVVGSVAGANTLSLDVILQPAACNP